MIHRFKESSLNKVSMGFHMELLTDKAFRRSLDLSKTKVTIILGSLTRDILMDLECMINLKQTKF
jgi:hypothetical protein